MLALGHHGQITVVALVFGEQELLVADLHAGELGVGAGNAERVGHHLIRVDACVVVGHAVAVGRGHLAHERAVYGDAGLHAGRQRHAVTVVVDGGAAVVHVEHQAEVRCQQ